MTKVPSIIIVTFLLITATYGDDATDLDTKLDQPICIIDNYTESIPIQELFKEFAVYEECQFHLFMDVLQEIDCYLIHKHSTNPPSECENEECSKALFNMRDEIYAHRVDNYICKCRTSRNDPESNNQHSFFSSLEYDYFTAELNEENKKEEEDKTIHTICQYIDCWDKLWTELTKLVKKKLVDILSEIPDENPVCKKIGQKNSARCSPHTTRPVCTEPTT